MKVRFIDFWPKFNPHNNFFTGILKKIYKDVEIVRSPFQVDLEISSVFSSYRGLIAPMAKYTSSLTRGMGLSSEGNFIARTTYGYRERSKVGGARRIWYTGEGRVPPFDHFDLTLSFEPTSMEDKNLYFPYWMYGLDWKTSFVKPGIFPSPELLSKPRIVEKRNYSAVIFSSNRDPFRMKLANDLEKIMKVERFGLAFSSPIESKLAASVPHLFQLCPENVVISGYVTEKLIEAWVCGCIPIWRGGMVGDIFNRDAYIDITNLSPYESIEKILGYTESDLRAMRELPILNYKPTLEEFLSAIQSLFED